LSPAGRGIAALPAFPKPVPCAAVLTAWHGLCRGLLLALAAAAVARAESDLETLLQRFRPDGPAAVLRHRIAYRFLGLEIRHLAESRLTVGLGDWQMATGGTQRATLLYLEVDSIPSRTVRRRVSLHNRVVVVLRVPDLALLLYARLANEYFDPWLRRARRIKEYTEYSFESGDLQFRDHNLLSGTIRTNTQDAAVLVAQSREIGRLTALLLDIYAGRHPPVRWHDGLSVMLHAEGRPVPFGVTAHPAASPVRYDGERAALLVRVGPPREPGVQGYDFMAWVTSFADLSRRRGDPELQRLSALAVCDSPVPLAVDFDLAVGCVRGALVAVAATNLPGSGWAAGGD